MTRLVIFGVMLGGFFVSACGTGSPTAPTSCALLTPVLGTPGNPASFHLQPTGQTLTPCPFTPAVKP